ncbi:MAG TPA: hypothetical protein GXX75_22630 [Clostridiales bacterium]|nr:hypothetical protein [Clostridiales bacterium]
MKRIAVSDGTRAWIELLSESAKEQALNKVSFPAFTWKKTELPDKLYVRESNGEYFLASCDGYFYVKVNSTDKLPFCEIANINGLYFEYENNKWCLKSYNPMIVTNTMG